MLPEVLSNELCSLRPHEDKLCFSAVFELDAEANIMAEWFGRTIIHSDRRFSYEEAQQIIETKQGDHAEAVLELDRMAKLLRKKRMALGGIDFDTEEVKFKLDEEGTPIFVFTKIMRDSNRLIEDFMLLANRKVAEFVGKTAEKKAKTFVYRVHDKPSEEKLSQLRLFVSRFGYELPKGNTQALPLLRTLLDLSKDKPEQDIIKQMSIRSMAKAEYSTHNIGHFGLSFQHYSHFTSPIRRYPDVMVHRLLAHYLEGGESASEKEFEFNCKHSSMREKRATEAERASIKYKQVQFLMHRIGEEFDGIISGLTNWGMYVELIESKCEGMVSTNNMLDDYYHFDEDRYIMRGNRTGKEYCMGQAVKIRVAAADLQKRQLDFELVVEGEDTMRPIAERKFKGRSPEKNTKSKGHRRR
jgi:ribonuclease R